MKRVLILVVLLIGVRVGAAAPLVAQSEVPTGPHASGDGWAFTVLAALVGPEFGEPLNWGPNEDGRDFLLVTMRVTNTTDDDDFIKSDRFGIVSGGGLVDADDGLSKRPDELGIPAMGDAIGDQVGGGDTKDYILGWRVDGDLNEYILDFGLGEASRLDLTPWIAQDIDPVELIPDPADRPTPPPTATLASTSTRAPTSAGADENRGTPDDGERSAGAGTPDGLTLDADYPADSQRDRIGGTGLQFVEVPDDAPDEVGVLTAGRGTDGSWGAIVRNGSDDFITGVSVAAVDADGDLGSTDSVFPTFLEPGDIGVVVGTADDADPDRDAGSASAEVTDSQDMTESLDEDSGPANAGVSVISAAIIDGDDGPEVLVTVENIVDDPVVAPEVGALCFDETGAIVGSLSRDFSDEYDFVEGDGEFTGTIPVGDIPCHAVLAGASTTLYEAPEAPRPTSTVRPRPANTPETKPTATEAAESGAITDDEQAYLDAVVRDTQELGDASSELGDLFSAAGDEEYLVLDADWQAEVESQLDVFTDAYDRAQGLSPSERQAEIHELWLSITSLVVSAADDYRLGIDTLDPALLTSGNEKLNQATALTDDLRDAIAAFRDDPGAASGSTGGSETISGPVAGCEAFATYEDAQAYYADHPEEQPTIDPDADGLACEVYFGRG